MKILLMMIALFGCSAFAQDAAQSEYIFRYNAGMSVLMNNDMTFSDERPIDLGACTATERRNGPISCTVNCSGTPVCLLLFSGPPGLTSEEVLEKAVELPTEDGLASDSARARAYLR